MDENAKDPKEENKQPKYDVSHAPTPHIVHVKKSPVKKIVLGLLIAVLLVLSGYLGYAYYQEKQNSDDLQNQLNSTTQETQQSTVQQDSSDPSTGQTTYNAEVGKFTLKLPSKYKIVELLDGDGEGGAATVIEVGVASDQGEAVVDNNSFKSLKITAISSSGYSSLQNYTTSILDEGEYDIEQQPEDAINIDGVSAIVFSAQGLGTTTYIFFEKNDMYYLIESYDISESGMQTEKQKDVIAGFKFN